jgi:hypothetical protein
VNFYNNEFYWYYQYWKTSDVDNYRKHKLHFYFKTRDCDVSRDLFRTQAVLAELRKERLWKIQGGSNMTGTICV